MAELIYVADDDTGLRTAYAAALHKLGYEVETASDGLEALNLVKKRKPNVILLDMLMPNLDGIGFLKALRADKANDDVIVIVVSNFESMPEANDYNVVKYLSKLQHDPEAVASRVADIIGGNHA